MRAFGLGSGAKNHKGSAQGEDGEKGSVGRTHREGKHKLFEIQANTEYDDGIQEDIRNRIKRLNDELKVRQESINLLKGRLTNQITGIKQTISKVLDRDTSLAKKIWTLFKEQDITIASVLMAIGMAIGVLVESLLPSSECAMTQGKGGGNDKPENVKEWLKNKLKAFALLLGKSGAKVVEALPGIIGLIISWILNRAKEVMGWVSQNLGALVIGIRGLLYMYMVTR